MSNFAETEAHAGCASTLDAAADDVANNAMCTTFCSPDNIYLAAGHPPWSQGGGNAIPRIILILSCQLMAKNKHQSFKGLGWN